MSTRLRSPRQLSGALACAIATLLSLAPDIGRADDRTLAIYGDLGRAAHGSKGDTDAISLGAMVPWVSFEATRSGAWSSYGDFFLSNWRAEESVFGRSNYLQLGAVAMFRYRFDDGGSPWFVEGGVGGTLMNHVYKTADRQFSTAFQFTEALGIGRSFGDHGQQELSLRVQHFSNGGIKEPNPGETFVKVRYAYRF